jgi:hypothetical protein
VLGITFLSDSRLFQGDYYSDGTFVSVVVGAVAFIVAVVLLRFARKIVQFTYPHHKEDTDA